MEIATASVVALAITVVLLAGAVGGWALTRTARTADPEAADELDAARRALGAAREETRQVVERTREQARAARAAAEVEVAARQDALAVSERRLAWLHEELTRARDALDERRSALEARRAALAEEAAALETAAAEARERRAQVAGTTREEAAGAVLARLDSELAAEHPGRVARAVNERIGDLAPTADMLLSGAIQRQESSHADTAPRGAVLPVDGLSDETRERLLGALAVVAEDTFTEVGLDADRQQVTLRGLDPVGREVARQASLEVLDRRLRAEEVPPLLMRTRSQLRRAIAQIGERVLWETGIDARPEVAELLGTLHYRFSYGQNALLHCQETGDLCAVLAAELRMDAHEARRAGLFHDIGKAVDHDVEGSHAIIGGEMLAVLGVDPEIVHAVKAHHFDEEPSTDLAMLTICADAISASRPGARRDTLTTYVQRLEQLQQIATRHRGVERAFPMQAGREVRVSVRPEQVRDEDIPALCGEIAREIEAEMQYPGMIKVTVIRETQATATAS